MKIVFWDIEISKMIYATFDPRSGYFEPDSLLQQSLIVCASWKVLGQKDIHSVVIRPGSKDDYEVVKTLRGALLDADLLVHHNGDRFDLKLLNSRLLYHNLDPLPHIPTVDTYKVIKKVCKLPSYKLDFLTKVFGLVHKQKIEGSIWLDITFLKPKALKILRDYNRQDVKCLEALYLKLLPYMTTHPHVGALKNLDRFGSCPKCGGTKIKKNGVRCTASGIRKQELQCRSCGGYFKVPLKDC